MPHLPSELWLLVLSFVPDPIDIWLSLRPLNRQLRTCTDQYFADKILPRLILHSPITFPTYDIRSPIHGKASFAYKRRLEPDPERAVFELVDTEPSYHRSHFVDRWKRMAQNSSDGRVPAKTPWRLQLDPEASVLTVRLKDAMFERDDDDSTGGDAQVSFAWLATIGALFAEVRGLGR